MLTVVTTNITQFFRFGLVQYNRHEFHVQSWKLIWLELELRRPTRSTKKMERQSHLSDLCKGAVGLDLQGVSRSNIVFKTCVQNLRIRSTSRSTNSNHATWSTQRISGSQSHASSNYRSVSSVLHPGNVNGFSGYRLNINHFTSNNKSDVEMK